MTSKRPSTVAIDFDGVIHRYSQGWHDGSIYDEPVDGAFDGLRRLMAEYAIYIHTTRESVQVTKWLHETGKFITIPDPGGFDFWNEQGVLLVSNRKLPAVAYIDDRAIRFMTWHQTLAAMRMVSDGVY